MLVSLLEPPEREAFGIADLLERAEAQGLRVLSLPMPDGGVPADRRDLHHAAPDDIFFACRRTRS